jgi:hypothetical protein
MNFAAEPATVTVQPGAGTWRKQLDAADSVWGGEGSKPPAQLTDGNLPNALTLLAYAVAASSSVLTATIPPRRRGVAPTRPWPHPSRT